MTSQELATHIEAILFSLGRGLSHTELRKLLEIEEDTLTGALLLLRKGSPGRGVVVVDDGSMVELRAAVEASEKIDHIRKDEYSREVGKAGLEVLAAILYRGPLHRSEIDFIRGVNSSQTLRTLTMRGLVRKGISEKGGSRGAIYEPTTELLGTLGVAHVSELQDHMEVRNKLEALEMSYRTSKDSIETT